MRLPVSVPSDGVPERALPQARPSSRSGLVFTLAYEGLWSGFSRKAGPALARMLGAVGVPAGRVVDLGCGTGHVALALSRRGYDVLGIDRCRTIVERARSRAPRASFRVSRIEDVRMPRGAAAVVSTFDTLNYVVDPSRFWGLFVAIHGALRPGGVLLFDMSTPARFARPEPLVQVRRERGLHLTLESRWEPGPQLATLRLTGFVRRGELWERFEEEHVQRAYDVEEIEALLGGAGFEYEQLSGYWEATDVKRPDRVFYLARPRVAS